MAHSNRVRQSIYYGEWRTQKQNILDDNRYQDSCNIWRGKLAKKGTIIAAELMLMKLVAVACPMHLRRVAEATWLRV